MRTLNRRFPNNFSALVECIDSINRFEPCSGAAVLARYFADGFNSHGMVVARKPGLKTMRTRDTLDGCTDVRAVTPYDVYEMGFGRTSVERHFIFVLVDCVERYTGAHPKRALRVLTRPMLVEFRDTVSLSLAFS